VLQVVILLVFWFITERRRLRVQALHIILAAGVFVAVALPTGYYALQRPDAYLQRINETNIYLNGWLEQEVHARGVSAAEVLWDQFQETLTVFVAGPDNFFYLGQSILTPAMFVLAALGLIYLTFHIRESRAFWLLSSLGLIVLLGGVLTVGPMIGSQRFVGAAPLIYIASAVFIDAALTMAQRRWHPQPRLWNALGTIVVVALMIMDADYYFGEYIPYNNRYSRDRESTQIGYYLRELEQQRGSSPRQVYCFGFAPVYCTGTTVQYLAPHLWQATQTMTQPFASTTLPTTVDLVLIFSPDATDDLQAAQRRYATAQQRTHSGVYFEPLFISLEVPAAP
jgi:hypothetical protein